MNKFLDDTYALNPSSCIGINLMRNENFISPEIDFSKIDHKKYLSSYPDKRILINKIAEKEEVHPDQIILGAGSSAVLDIGIRASLCVGKFAHIDDFTYKPIEQLVKRTGAKIKRYITPYYSNVRIIVNPNNPTGDFPELPNPRNYDFVIIDEAYIDYYPKEKSMKFLLLNHKNVLITRTFSKLYGIAGMRIGYGITSKEYANILRKVSDPYNIPSFTLHAAMSVIDDVGFLEKSLAQNKESLNITVDAMRKLGVEMMTPCANFVTVKLPNLIPGFTMRDLEFYSGLKGWSRISTQPPEDMKKFIIEVEKYLEK